MGANELQHLPELRRRDAHNSPENLGEMALVHESGRICDSANCEFVILEEYFRTVNPAP